MASHLYEFDDYRLDPAKRRLTRAGELVPLTPKAFETLLVLVDSHGKNLTRAELITRIWPDTSVGEHNLNQCIAVLRKVFGDHPRQPNYIATLPGHGYSFIAEVSQVPGGSTELDAGASDHLPSLPGWQRVESPPRSAGNSLRQALMKGRRAYVLAASVLLLIVLVVPSRWSKVRSAFIPNPLQSVSVLPFVNLGSDPQDQYVSEGLSEELAAELGEIPLLKVVAGGSRPQAGDGDVRAIARELGAGSVLKGSVRQSGGQYRIAVQLIDGNDGRELWSAVYSGTSSDLPVLEEQIVRHTTDVLRVPVARAFEESMTRRTSENPEAHELYLQARYLWSKRDLQMPRSLSLFQQAITKDPLYAKAWAGLADWYAVEAANQQMPVGEAVPQARHAAEKALELDPTMAEPHAALGLLKSKVDWDWQSAQQEFNRALALDPGYATVHHWAGLNLMDMGKFEEADAELRKAQELDPLSPMISEGRFENFYCWHRFDDAIQVIQNLQARDIDSQNLTWVPWVLSMGHIAKGQYQEAYDELRTIDNAAALKPDGIALRMAQVEALMGNRQAARVRLTRIEGKVQPGDSLGMYIAIVHVALGEPDQAIHWLNRAYQEREPVLAEIQWQPEFDSIKQDPRFQALVRKVGSTQ